MCLLCGKVGIYAIPLNRKKRRYVERLEAAIRKRQKEEKEKREKKWNKRKRGGKPNDIDEKKVIFAHLIGQGHVLLDIEEASKHFHERDYPDLATFKGEKLKPIFLPQVFLNCCPQIVEDFDEAMESVLKRLEHLEEQQKNDITKIKDELQALLKDNEDDSKVAKLISDSLDRLNEIKEAKMNRCKAVEDVELKLKKEVKIMVSCGYLQNEEAKARGEEISWLRNYKIPEIERARSDFVEKEVIDQLKKYLHDNKVTSFVIRGLEVFKLEGIIGQDQQEVDVLLVDYDKQIIVNIEAKSRLGREFAKKAGIQLETIRNIIIDYFDSELNGQWRFVSAVFCTSNNVDEIKSCSSASKFVFSRENNDFQEKFEQIMNELGQSWDKHPVDFSTLTRHLTYLFSKFELPTTNNIHAEIKKRLDAAGSVENIKFLACSTPQQQGLTKICDNPGYKMAFIGAWGTGKTMFLKHCAIQLAKKGEKVLFIVAQRGDIVTTNVKTLLILELEETFKEFGDLIKVISLPITDGTPTRFEEVTDGYHHIIIDEFFDDFDKFKESTVDEIMKTLKSKVTVALTLSNSYFNKLIPSTINIKSKVESMLPDFHVLMLDKPLRQPLNIITKGQETYRNVAKVRSLGLNERLVADATLPPNLIAGLDTLYLGLNQIQSLFTLLPQAFDKCSKEALIVIEDSLHGPMSFINKQIYRLIKCQCKDKAIYIALDIALEKSGRPEPFWQTLRKQSNEDDNKAWISGDKKGRDCALSRSLTKGCECEYIINTTGYSEVKSRVSGQLIEIHAHMYLTMLLVAEFLNNQDHVCHEILERKKRPPMLDFDINHVLEKAASVIGYSIFSSADVTGPQKYVFKNTNPILRCLVALCTTDPYWKGKFRTENDLANEVIKALEEKKIKWPGSDLIDEGQWIEKMKEDILFYQNYTGTRGQMKKFEHILLSLTSAFLGRKIKLYSINNDRPEVPDIFNFDDGTDEFALLGCTSMKQETFYISLQKLKTPQKCILS